LNQIMNGTTFSRFVIAPSDSELVAKYQAAAIQEKEPTALQCGALGAFGGFFERKFRAHDYALGRRNCQKFLRDSFVLPADNVIMKGALDSLQPYIRTALVAKFSRPAPGTYAESGVSLEQEKQDVPDGQMRSSDIWLPIIPLCAESVSNSIPPVERAQMIRSPITRLARAPPRASATALKGTPISISALSMRLWARRSAQIVPALAAHHSLAGPWLPFKQIS
jgi:hypothetical protein